jgi:hypothetical protein
MPNLYFKTVAQGPESEAYGHTSGSERESIWYVPVSAPTVRADLTISDGTCWLSLGAAVEFISQCQRNQVSLWRQESEELSAQGLAIDTKERSSSVG